MIYHYARVSTKDQVLDRQLEALEAYKKADRVFTDKQSGKSMDRKEYQVMKALLQSGDEVVIKEMDRLGRNKELIKEEIRWFQERGVILRILDLPTSLIDFQGQKWIGEMINNLLIEVLSSVAEQERLKIRKRQREGIDAMQVVDGKKVSRKTGKTYGRQNSKPVDFDQYLKRVKAGQMTVIQACKEMNIPRSSFYNYRNETEAV